MRAFSSRRCPALGAAETFAHACAVHATPASLRSKSTTWVLRMLLGQLSGCCVATVAQQILLINRGAVRGRKDRRQVSRCPFPRAALPPRSCSRRNRLGSSL